MRQSFDNQRQCFNHPANWPLEFSDFSLCFSSMSPETCAKLYKIFDEKDFLENLSCFHNPLSSSTYVNFQPFSHFSKSVSFGLKKQTPLHPTPLIEYFRIHLIWRLQSICLERVKEIKSYFKSYLVLPLPLRMWIPLDNYWDALILAECCDKISLGLYFIFSGFLHCSANIVKFLINLKYRNDK